jgi:hypothetical protein
MMNAEQTSDNQALEKLLDNLAKSAVAEIHALDRRTAAQNEPASINDDTSDENDEDRYFESVARPLGKAALSAHLLGSMLISEDRGE